MKQWKLKRIPKQVHFYYGQGHQKMSWLRYLSYLSFRVYNPDWKIYVHVPDVPYCGEPTWKQDVIQGKNDTSHFHKLKQIQNLEFITHKFTGTKLENAFETYRADFLRHKILFEYGGVFSDSDIVFVNPVTQLLQNNQNYSDVGLFLCKYRDRDQYPIGFIMSQKGNSFIQLLQGDILTHLNLERYQSIGPEYVKRMIKNNANLVSSKNFLTPNCVYKVLYDELDLLVKENITYTDQQGVIGFHWYAGSPKMTHISKHLTETNYNLKKTTLTTAICKLMKSV